MAKKLKIYNGSSWEDVTFAITPPSTSVTNTFNTNQVIDTSTSVAALRVTQRGTGEVLRLEDETNPDSSPFIVDSTGNVGLGMQPSVKLDVAGITWQRGSASAGAVLITNPDSTSGSNGVTLEASFASGGYGPIIFKTSGSESLRITPEGNLGVSTSNPTYKIQTSSTLAATLGSQALVYQAYVGNGNADYFKIYQERTSATTSWNGSDWILRRQVDSSPMGGFRWAAGDWNVRAIYGIPANASVRTTHIGTSAPSGGIDGDVWLVYTA